MVTENEEKTVVVDGERTVPQPVDFPSLDPYILKDLRREAAEVPTLQTHGELFLPEDAAGETHGRPAVVIVQGLGGQKPERELTYGHKLSKAGYVALALDSFRARDLADADDKRKALQVTTWTIMADVFAALRFLAEHPAVDPKAISVMGFSWGGMATMLAVYEQIRRAYLGDDSDLRFAGHVAYYGCSIPRLEDPTTTGAPMLVLIAKHDENVSVERTHAICEDMRRGGSQVELKILDAFHQWDGKDVEKRHVFGSLADLAITITKDNELREERWNAEIESALSQAFLILRDLRWGGYDILRDDEKHRESDQMLLDFLADVARRQGAPEPDKAAVPLGQIGKPPEAEKEGEPR